MKVAHCIYFYLPITENWIYDQIKGLSDNYSSIILAGVTKNKDEFPHSNLISFESLNKLNIGINRLSKRLNIRRIPGLWKKNLAGVDIVHSHFGDEGYRNYKDCNRLGKKHLVSFYGYDLTSYLRIPSWLKRYNKMFSYVDKIIVEGTNAKKSLVEIGCNENIIDINHLGIDVDVLPFRIRSYIESKKINVLMAASFVEKKGFVYGIRALGILQKKGLPFNLTIIGDASNSKSAIKNEIMYELKKTNLLQNTRLLGYVSYSKLIEEIHNNDFFLSPNVIARDGDSEGGAPVVLLHAQGAGMPVISTTVCDIPEYVKNKETGILVEERNVDQLVLAIEELVSNLSYYSSKCRIHISNNYNKKDSMIKLESIYRELFN